MLHCLSRGFPKMLQAQIFWPCSDACQKHQHIDLEVYSALHRLNRGVVDQYHSCLQHPCLSGNKPFRCILCNGTFLWLIVQVNPEGGVLPAGESAGITVRFTPQEVEDCSRNLVATIPNLASNLRPPNRPMTASVLRPWCHFDLPPSDYITAGQLAL